MVFGTYNIVLSNVPSVGQNLIYNTLSKSCHVLSQSLCEELRSGCIPPELTEDEVQELRTRLVLVEDEDVERAILLYRLSEQRYSGGTLNLTVYTTYRCNFGCIYCYERDSDVLNSAEMSLQTIDDLLKWLECYVEDRNISELNLELYGGEPLCNMAVVRYLVQQIGSFVSERDISIQTYVITNGSLLTSDVVRTLRKINLRQVQVTIDGFREYHDRRRPFRNGDPSYDVITKNLLNLSNICSLALRVNVDQYVLTEPGLVFRLVDELTSMGIPQSMETSIQISSVFGWDWDCGCLNYALDYRNLRDLRLRLYPYAMSKGFEIMHPLKNAPCFAISTGNFCIDPYGDVYPCTFLVGKTDYRIGKVTMQEFTPTYFKMQTAQPFDEKCLECRYLPTCLGGCRANALIEGKGIEGKVCAKQFYDEAVVPFLELYYAGIKQ